MVCIIYSFLPVPSSHRNLNFNTTIPIPIANILLTGLHFNPPAYRVLYDELRQTLEQTWPDSNPERLEKHFPDWNSWF